MAGNENFFQHTKETNIIHKPQTTRPQLYVKYTTRKLKKFPTNIKNEKGTYREKERKKLLTFSHVFRKRQNYLFEVGAERTTASIETWSCADYFRKFVFVSGSRRRQSKSSLLKVPIVAVVTGLAIFFSTIAASMSMELHEQAFGPRKLRYKWQCYRCVFH